MVKSPRHKRPRSVTITIWGVLLLGLANGWQALVLLQQRQLLVTLEVTVSPLFRLVVAGGWAILFVGAALAIWHKRRWMRRLLPVLLIIYALYQLSLLLFFAESTLARQGWLLDLLQFALIVAWSWWALNRAAARAYFGE